MAHRPPRRPASIIAPSVSIPAARQNRSKRRRHFVPRLTHRRARHRTRHHGRSLHGVAFLSWNQHPEPTGSRRATPLLLFQHRPGQFHAWACASAKPQPWKSQAMIAPVYCFGSSVRVTRSAACRCRGQCSMICVAFGWPIATSAGSVLIALALGRSARMRCGAPSVSVFARRASHARSVRMRCGIARARRRPVSAPLRRRALRCAGRDGDMASVRRQSARAPFRALVFPGR